MVWYHDGIPIDSIGIDDTSFTKGIQLKLGGSPQWLSHTLIYDTTLSDSVLYDMSLTRNYPTNNLILFVPFNQTTNVVDLSPIGGTLQAFGAPTLMPPQPDDNNCLACGCSNNQTCCVNTNTGVCSMLQDNFNCGACSQQCIGENSCCCSSLPCFCTSGVC